MSQDIEKKDYPNGWFGKHTKCALGKDIYEWILKFAESDKSKAF